MGLANSSFIYKSLMVQDESNLTTKVHAWKSWIKTSKKGKLKCDH